jgi:hypothetical protein
MGRHPKTFTQARKQMFELLEPLHVIEHVIEGIVDAGFSAQPHRRSEFEDTPLTGVMGHKPRPGKFSLYLSEPNPNRRAQKSGS